MKIEGTQTVYGVEIDVSMNDLLEVFEGEIRKLYKWPGDYINKKGEWESWFRDHGSGSTEQYRLATEEESKLFQAWCLVRHSLKYPPKKD